MGPGVRRQRWRPGLPLEGPPGLCPARLLRTPGPGPAAGRRSSPARRGLFTVRRRPAPPPSPPPLASEAEAEAFAKPPPAAEGCMSGVGGGLAQAPGEGSLPPPFHPPPHLSMALWLQHS